MCMNMGAGKGMLWSIYIFMEGVPGTSGRTFLFEIKVRSPHVHQRCLESSLRIAREAALTLAHGIES